MLSRHIAAAVVLSATLTMSGCANWVYRIDIPQGNYLEQKEIDKLQIGMTKEQVRFVLGNPVVTDTFENDVWYYVYRFKSGRSDELNREKRFTIYFEDNKLVKTDGDFELPESFYTPMEN